MTTPILQRQFRDLCVMRDRFREQDLGFEEELIQNAIDALSDEYDIHEDQVTNPFELSPGSTLKELRLLNVLTVRDVARAADVSPTTVSSIENGARKPSRKTLLAITMALGLGTTTTNQLLRAWEHADLPQKNYALWNEVMQCLEKLHQIYYSQDYDAAMKQPEKLTALMEAYDRWLE